MRIGGPLEIKPIKWKPYKGDMVNTVLTIRNGKKT